LPPTAWIGKFGREAIFIAVAIAKCQKLDTAFRNGIAQSIVRDNSQQARDASLNKSDRERKRILRCYHNPNHLCTFVMNNNYGIAEE